MNARDNRKMAPLYRDAIAGRVDIAALLIEAPGINVNARDVYKMTPLHRATTHSEAAIVGLLLHAPWIDVNACDRCRMSPLHIAMAAGERERDIVSMLVGDPRVDAMTDPSSTERYRTGPSPGDTHDGSEGAAAQHDG